MSSNILERAMMELVHNEPFFANLLLNMTRKYDFNMPTIGVNVTDTINLIVNPHFWNQLTLPEQVDMLKHECYHVIHNHFARFAELEPQTYSKEIQDMTLEERQTAMQNASKLNIAGDYAINEFLPNLPKKVKTFDKEGNPLKDDQGKVITGEGCLVKNLKKEAKQHGIDCEHYKNTEYYYDIMKQLEKKKPPQPQGQQGQGGGGGNGPMTIDDHSVWQTGSQDSEYITEKVKQVVGKAVEASGGREAGNIPGDVLIAIDALNHKPRDWRSDLRRFVARTAEIFVESSRKRRNRRYGNMYAGNSTYQRLTLAALVDASGSVRDEELAQFGAELYNITKQEVVIWIVDFDSRVNSCYRVEKGELLREAVGRGGTAFGPPFEKAKELEVDGIIMFSDMENFDIDAVQKPKVPVLWACLESGSQPHYNWGSRTTITVKKKLKD